MVSESEWRDRAEILDDVLGMVEGKMVLVRTPELKMRCLGVRDGELTVNGSTAFGGSKAARIGFHNDCFGGA